MPVTMGLLHNVASTPPSIEGGTKELVPTDHQGPGGFLCLQEEEPGRIHHQGTVYEIAMEMVGSFRRMLVNEQGH
jgi:hypothetical protein